MPARGYEFYLRAECSTRYLTSEKDAIYYLAITTVISSRVKVTSYFHLI